MGVPKAYRPCCKTFLNLLGATLGVSVTSYPTAYPSGPSVAWSQLGEAILDPMPERGYPSEEAFRETVGDQIYRVTRRFVTIQESLPPLSGLFPLSIPDPTLHLNGIPHRLIETFLRYQRVLLEKEFEYVGFNFSSIGLRGYPQPAYVQLDGTDPEAKLWAKKYPLVMIIHPAQANAVSRTVNAARTSQGGIRSHLSLYRLLLEGKESHFPAFQKNWLDPTHPTKPVLCEAIQNVKTDMAYHALKGWTDPISSPAISHNLDADRYTVWASDPGYFPGPGRQLERLTIADNQVTSVLTPPPSSGNYQGDDPFSDTSGHATHLLPDWTMISSPTDFDVASLGISTKGTRVRIDKALRARELLTLTTVEDFMNYACFPAPWGTGDASRRLANGFAIKGKPGISVSSDTASRSVVPSCFPPDHIPPPGGQPLKPVNRSGPLSLGWRTVRTPSLPNETARIPLHLGGGPDLDAMEHLEWIVKGTTYPIIQSHYSDYLPPEWASASQVETAMTGGHVPDPSFSTFQARIDDDDYASERLYRYVFQQSQDPDPSWNKDPLPRLDVPSIPVKGWVDPMSGITIFKDGDVQAIQRLGVHFTLTGRDTQGNNPFASERFRFKLRTFGWSRVESGIPVVMPSMPQGGYTELLVNVLPNGAWIVRSLLELPGIWDGDVWTIPNYNPLTMKYFGGLYYPLKPPPLNLPPDPVASPHPPSWHDQDRPHRATLYFHAQDSDNMYPFDAGTIGLWVNGQHVSETSFDYSTPFDSVGLFFLNEKTPCGPDRRRFLEVLLHNCSDIVFFDPEVGNNETNHLAYLKDFYLRTGSYTSPRYIFPEPVDVDRIDWEGMIPQEIWQQQGPDALRFTARLYDESDTLIHTMTLTAKEAGPDLALTPGALVPDLPRRIASFDFSADFDCSACTEPLLATPVMRSVSVLHKRKPRWTTR